MTQNIFKDKFAELAANAFQAIYADIYNANPDESIFTPDFILSAIEKPKDVTMGRFALPIFRYGKLLKDNPPGIAQNISEHINQHISEDNLISTTATGGFINIQTNFNYETSMVLDEILSGDSDYGYSTAFQGKNILVEYSAPNIAKPFGIGHIRTTILGNSLRRIFAKLGADVVGINYLGDWGTQFGKMMTAYKKWADPAINGKETVSDLLELYVKFHEEVENNQELEDEARDEFKKLEKGDDENQKLWQRFRDLSLEEFDRIYKLIGIEFDWVTGEAYLEDKMEPVIKRLEQAGLTSISDGALIVDLHDEQIPPVLLKKGDGATLYATRDIAGFLYRVEKYQFDEMLYVVAVNQSVHFQQIFKTISLLEKAEQISEDKQFAKRAKHIDFGMIKFGDQMMSTRRGNIIFLEDVIMRAAELAKEKMSEKNPDLKTIEETSLMIGLGAVMFSQLSVRRSKDVNFNWEEVLSFEGETGPYLQYTHARLCSLMRNFGNEINADLDVSLLNNEEEQRIVELLADFPQTIVDAGRNYEPSLIASHLLRLAAAFNKLYQRKDENGRTDKIVSENIELSQARIGLVNAVQIVIKEGLYLLGIKAPEEM